MAVRDDRSDVKQTTTGFRGPLMVQSLTSAKSKFLSLSSSWIIGDKEVDVQAANAAGISNTILVESGHTVDNTSSDAKFILKSIQDSIGIIR